MNSITGIFGSIIRSITQPRPQPNAGGKLPIQAAILPAGGGAIRGGTTNSSTGGGGIF